MSSKIEWTVKTLGISAPDLEQAIIDCSEMISNTKKTGRMEEALRPNNANGPSMVLTKLYSPIAILQWVRNYR